MDSFLPLAADDYSGPEHEQRNSATIRDDNLVEDETERGSKKPWTDVEEVFLTGIVMEYYFRRHSLKSAAKDKSAALRDGFPLDTLVWRKVHESYYLGAERYFLLTGEELTKRSFSSLQKHWKESSNQKSLTSTESICSPNYLTTPSPTKQRYQRWDLEYNMDNRLLCGENEFSAYLEGHHFPNFIEPAMDDRTECLSAHINSKSAERKKRRLG